jgi:EAL domain-containing protein (putative c-di-GMP-specific phosphodiesterase class I)
MQQNLTLIQKSISLLSYSRSTRENRFKMKKERIHYKEFQRIINKKCFDTFFQPIVNIESGLNIGYEVFNRPVDSTIFYNTEYFYDFIGKTNQPFVVDEICLQLAVEKFVHQFRQPNKEFLLFINIYPDALLDHRFNWEKIFKVMNTYGIAPENIVFEISEKTRIEDYDKMNEALFYFRNKGIKFALDDVGSGYNSLKTMVLLKPEYIKLDKSLIQFIDQSKAKQQLMEFFMDLSNKLHFYLVAEGIERVEEIEYLKRNGVHIGQGYAIGKPSKKITTGKLPEIKGIKSM